MTDPLWPYRVLAGLLCGWYIGRYGYLWITEAIARRNKRKTP